MFTAISSNPPSHEGRGTYAWLYFSVSTTATQLFCQADTFRYVNLYKTCQKSAELFCMLCEIPPLLFMSEPEASRFSFTFLIKSSNMTLNCDQNMRDVQNLCYIRKSSMITLCFRQNKHIVGFVGFEYNCGSQITAPKYCFWDIRLFSKATLFYPLLAECGITRSNTLTCGFIWSI